MMGKNQIGVFIIESNPVQQSFMAQSFQNNSLVSLVEVAADTDAALLKVIDFDPDVAFIEYPLKGKTGLGIIKFIHSKFPGTTIVFISKSIVYAVDAIRHEVYHYLIKPVSVAELDRIIEKVYLKKQSNSSSRINEIIENQQEDARLRFLTTRGFSIINPNEILYCKADGSYTELHLLNKSFELASLFLWKVEELFSPYGFVRISRSVIVNRNYIRKVFQSSNKLILSVNGEEYELLGTREPMRALRKIYFE